MKNYLVFREEPVSAAGILHRQQHNEREAEVYANANIDLARKNENIYFKKPTGDYMEMVQERIDAGELSIKGLKADAGIFSEIVIGVNTDFWVNKDETYRREFFEAVYEWLKNKFGEENIISCVWHRDEIFEGKINEHIHCVAVPTVRKKRYYSKRSVQYQELMEKEGKVNPHDERLLKNEEVQISHSKFFASSKDEKHRIIYSYTLLQDEVVVELQKKGFDIRRGITGQAGVKHLSPLQYKAVMQRLELQGDVLAPQIHPIRIDEDTVALPVEEYDAVVSLKEKASKQTAAYAEAVDVYVEEQKKLTEKKQEIYAVAKKQSQIEFEEMQYEQLKEEAKRLREENEMLKSAIEFIKEKVQTLVSCFKKVITNWISLRTDSQVDASKIMAVIDNEVRNGITILNNENIEKGGRIR